MNHNVILVSSSWELSSSQKHTLEQKVRAKFGVDSPIEFSIDPHLIAGISVRVREDEVYINLDNEINHILTELFG